MEQEIVIKGKIEREYKEPIPKEWNHDFVMEWSYQGHVYVAKWRMFKTQPTPNNPDSTIWISVSSGRYYAQIPIKSLKQVQDFIEWLADTIKAHIKELPEKDVVVEEFK